MISQKLKAKIKLGDEPAYKIAQKAGIDPSTLSKIICEIVSVKEGDPRVVKIGKIVGLRPEECFQEANNYKEPSA